MKKLAKITVDKMIGKDLLYHGAAEMLLPMITVNSLNEIIDFNESCLPNVGYADIGLEVEIRPLVDSKHKSFPYTAVLTLKGNEYLACVSLANPKSAEYKNIYFSSTSDNSADAFLTSRFIIEQKYTELHSISPLSTDGEMPFKRLQRLMMLVNSDSNEEKDVTLEKLVEYTVESYKNRFGASQSKEFEFRCDIPLKADEGLTSLAVSLVTVGMVLASERAKLEVGQTPLGHVFTLSLPDKKFIGDISRCGFSGMFLSRVSCLNYWKTELVYNAQRNETTVKIFVPKSSASHRFSAQTRAFDALAYAHLLIEAFAL